MHSTDSEHKFHKTGIGKWLPIGFTRDRLNWKPAVITTTLCPDTNGESCKVPYTHPKSLGITLERFHFPETVQVFSNSTPITQSSINPQYNKTQPLLT